MLRIRILGVPIDLGQERRGVDMGPSAVRAAGPNHVLKSLGHEVEEKMPAFELVEINPIIDLTNKTAILGVILAASTLGKKIL